MAGWEGFEPPLAVLETAALPLNYHPRVKFLPSELLGFAVKRALLFEGAELHDFDTFGLRLLVTRCGVITALAFCASQDCEFAGHGLDPFRLVSLRSIPWGGRNTSPQE